MSIVLAMNLNSKHFLSTSQLSPDEIESIFDRARLFKEEFTKRGRFNHLVTGDGIDQKVLVAAFFEPSTRTRLSFQLAAYRIGIKATTFDNLAISSVSKGESLADTMRNIAAMGPDVLCVRYGASDELDEAISELECPVINAGSGAREHPSQALLDAFTILENRGSLDQQRVVIVGDVLHSRVANSNLTLLMQMGAEVAYCAPPEFAPKDGRWKSVQRFDDLEEALRWATVCMGLRIQKERHTSKGIGLSMAEYRERYRIGTSQLEHLQKDGLLLHPGPVIRGIEISSAVLRDPRNKILDQVSNGVFIRAALLTAMLGLEVNKQ